MTEREYRQHPAISRSELWKMNESPEKFKWYKDHPQPPTPSLLFGQVVHKLLLQPDDFDTDFAIAPELDRRTKAGKDAYNAFCDGLGERSVVPPEMYLQAVEMAQKALSEPYVKKLLSGEKEVPFFWTDHDTGEECKCRVDCLTDVDGTLTIVDYKTAANAKTDVFNNSIFKWGYDFQAGMYSEGVMNCLNLDVRPKFVFVVQEKTPPYAINIITIPDEVMLVGLDKFREYIGIFHECNMTGFFWGYTGIFNEPNEAFLPGYLSIGNEEDD